MDHSVSGYLQRRTTGELEGALMHYLQGKNCLAHAYEITAILCVLETRYAPSNGELPVRIQQALAKYQALLTDTKKS